MDKEWFKTVVRLYLRQNTKKENLAYKEKKVFGRSISEKTREYPKVCVNLQTE